MNHRCSHDHIVSSAAHGQDKWLVDHVLPFMPMGAAAPLWRLAPSTAGLAQTCTRWRRRSNGRACASNRIRRCSSSAICAASLPQIHGLICQTTANVTYVAFEPPHEQGNGIVELMDAYKARIVREFKVRSRTPMKCHNLPRAVRRHLATGTIDVLSLDVEGSEVSVLQSIDFTLLRINVIMVEVSHEAEVTALLRREKVYQLVAKVGDDNVFFRVDAAPLMAHYRTACSCITSGECRHKLIYRFSGPGWRCSP